MTRFYIFSLQEISATGLQISHIAECIGKEAEHGPIQAGHQ
jgi:hypothetical protein